MKYRWFKDVNAALPEDSRLRCIGWLSSRVSGKRTHRRIKLICKCGNYISVDLQAAISGITKSCGCLLIETGIKVGKMAKK